ncbi:hypothetical protein ACW4TU_36965 [Streptomyces sp. QTS52]
MARQHSTSLPVWRQRPGSRADLVRVGHLLKQNPGGVADIRGGDRHAQQRAERVD